MSKFTIVVWNSDDYANRYAAKAEGATIEREIPKQLSSFERDNYVGAFVEGLHVAAIKLGTPANHLQYEVVELKAFSMSADVCEWNRYHFTVYAENEESAVQMAIDEHPTSFPRDDIEWGVESMIGDQDVKNIKVHK